MKPVDVQLNMYINFDKENNREGTKSNIVIDLVKISKYKNIFAKGNVSN